MHSIMKIVIIFAALLNCNVFSSYYKAPPKGEVLIGYHGKNGGRHGGIHPFKIHTVYDVEKSMAKLNRQEIDYVKELVDKALLPIGSLKIKQEPFIFLNHTCDEYRQGGQVRCKSNCKAPKCGSMEIPSTLLGSCTVDNRIEKEERVGINAHFVLFVSVDTIAKECTKDEVFSIAAHCQQGEMDRPVAGYLDVCREKVLDRDLRSRVVNELTHDILHILAFSDTLYPFYHDSNGKPRTSRNVDTNLPEMGKSFFQAGSTIKEVSINWLAASEVVERKVKMLITETVANLSKLHFGCDDLEGAALEDGAGIDGFEMVHFEKRVFKGEIMTGTHDQEYVFSALTLAVLQDSGWYIVNWTNAQPLAYAHGVGCKFVRTSCLEYVQTSCQDCFNPYCDELKDKSLYSQVWNKRCSKNRKAVVTCPIKEYSNELKSVFQYFHLANKTGGQDPLLDYCPIYQTFDWDLKAKNVARSICADNRSNNKLKSVWHELFGNNSICLDFHKAWAKKNCLGEKILKPVLGGCYKYECRNNRLYIVVRRHNHVAMYLCPKKGHTVVINRQVEGGVVSGGIVCPDCSELCNDCVSKELTPVEKDRINGDHEIDVCLKDAHDYEEMLNRMRDSNNMVLKRFYPESRDPPFDFIPFVFTVYACFLLFVVIVYIILGILIYLFCFDAFLECIS